MVKKISREELMGMISSGQKFKLVDVLSRDHFAREHIKGAISLPLGEIEKAASKLLRMDDTIVVYCASFECQASTQAAEELFSLGYKKVLDYKGGLKDYREAMLPMEGSLHEAIPKSCSGCSVL